MPPVIPQHLEVAKKRMRQGLHPAVLAAVARAGGLHERRQTSTRDVDPRSVDIGTAVNRMSPGLANASLYGGESGATARLGQTYHRLLREGPGGKIQEIHDYGGKLGSVAFDRKMTPELQSALAQQKTVPTVSQHLSNTATAEDKMIALAHKAAAAKLAGGVGTKRRFSNDAPITRLAPNVPPPRITEDDPRWNASTMGNKTGYYKGTYYDHGKKSRGGRNYNKGNRPG